MLKPGASLHTFDASPAISQEAESARLVLNQTRRSKTGASDTGFGGDASRADVAHRVDLFGGASGGAATFDSTPANLGVFYTGLM